MVGSPLCIDSWMGSRVSLCSCSCSWLVVEPGWRPEPLSWLPSLCLLSLRAPSFFQGVGVGMTAPSGTVSSPSIPHFRDLCFRADTHGSLSPVTAQMFHLGLCIIGIFPGRTFEVLYQFLLIAWDPPLVHGT